MKDSNYNNSKQYLAPTITVVSFVTEAGFAGSSIPMSLDARVDGATWQSDDDFNNAAQGTYFQR